MHKLYQLKEMLCEELKEYGDKEKLDVGGLEVVDKLAHAIKNIDKIIEAYEEEEYSMAGGGGSSYEGGRSMERGGGGRSSYARGGRGGGRSSYESYGRGESSYARRRDARGRYSRAEDDFMMQMQELMQDAPNDRIRQKMQSIMSEM